jgi:hypothetical protein
LQGLRGGLEDDPQVLEHDRNDRRGSACDIGAYTSDGRRMFVRIGYARRPIRIVTAYYFDAPPADEDEEYDDEEEEEHPGGP